MSEMISLSSRAIGFPHFQNIIFHYTSSSWASHYDDAAILQEEVTCRGPPLIMSHAHNISPYEMRDDKRADAIITQERILR